MDAINNGFSGWLGDAPGEHDLPADMATQLSTIMPKPKAKPKNGPGMAALMDDVTPAGKAKAKGHRGGTSSSTLQIEGWGDAPPLKDVAVVVVVV